MNNKMKNFKEKLNSNINRNHRFVNVKECRTCANCGAKIMKTNLCLTTNNRNQGRKWYCIKCVESKLKSKDTKNVCEVYKDIVRTEIELNALSFDDEGAYMAYQESIAELQLQCEGCTKKCRFNWDCNIY